MGQHQVVILLYECEQPFAGFVSVPLLLVYGALLFSGY